MEQGGAASCRHILAIPYPMMGHMTPMVQLCKMLIAKGGCRVTMVSVERNLPNLLKLLPKEHEQHDMKVITISDGMPLDLGPPNWDTFRDLLLAHHGLLRSLELHIPTSLPDIACVISDAHFVWTQDLANQLGVPRIALWVSAAAEFQVYQYAPELIKLGKLPFKAPRGQAKCEGKGIDNMMENRNGRPPVYHRVDEGCDDIEEKLEVPGLQPLSRRDFPSFLQIEDPSDVFFYRWIDNVKNCSQASLLLFNSFDALEGPLIALIRSQYGIPAHHIGPLFLLENVVLKEQMSITKDQNEGGDEEVKRKITINNGLEEVPSKCLLEWLDNQDPRSVLYVAFGTVIKLSEAQIHELALGLKASKQPFIWVHPKDGEGKELPKDFLDHVKGKGIVVDWAPQQKILQHTSIGGFLSHCGWNSIMEAICSGVPMIALPYVCDQTLHCKMIVEEWKVALRLERNLDGIALAHDISMLTQEILLKERGKVLRKRAQELMVSSKNSIQVGGSSHLTLDAIIKLIN